LKRIVDRSYGTKGYCVSSRSLPDRDSTSSKQTFPIYSISRFRAIVETLTDFQWIAIDLTGLSRKNLSILSLSNLQTLKLSDHKMEESNPRAVMMRMKRRRRKRKNLSQSKAHRSCGTRRSSTKSRHTTFSSGKTWMTTGNCSSRVGYESLLYWCSNLKQANSSCEIRELVGTERERYRGRDYGVGQDW